MIKQFKMLPLLITVFTISAIHAAIPRTITYQGLLTDPAGNPVADGNHTVAFSLYDAQTTGTLIWGEEQHTVVTSKGLFVTQLGSINPLVIPFDKQYWIEIKVNSKAVLPRIPLTASAYAMRADSADVARSVLPNALTGKADVGHQHFSLVRQGGSTNSVIVDTAGRVGIGTSEPIGLLDVNSAGPALRLRANSFTIGKIDTDSNQLVFDSPFSGIIKFKTAKLNLRDASGLERMRIDANGNVGIGTISPDAKLDLGMGTNGPKLLWYNDDPGTKYGKTKGGIYLDQFNMSNNTTIVFPTHVNHPGTLIFASKNTTDTILVPQLTLFGQKSAEDCKIDIKGDVSFGASTGTRFRLLGLQNTSYSYTVTSKLANCLAIFSDHDSIHPFSIDMSNNVAIGSLSSNGYKLYVDGSAFSTGTWTSSDRRYKLNITSIDSSLKKVSELQGVYYHWNRKDYSPKNFPETRQIGLIAQDVEKILPELVNTDSQGYKSLSYDKLTAVLIEAVKELKSENEALRQEIQSIKERLNGNDGAVR